MMCHRFGRHHHHNGYHDHDHHLHSRSLLTVLWKIDDVVVSSLLGFFFVIDVVVVIVVVIVVVVVSIAVIICDFVPTLLKPTSREQLFWFQFLILFLRDCGMSAIYSGFTVICLW